MLIIWMRFGVVEPVENSAFLIDGCFANKPKCIGNGNSGLFSAYRLQCAVDERGKFPALNIGRISKSIGHAQFTIVL